MFIFERESERVSTHVGEGQKEGETEPEAGSRLRAVGTEPEGQLKLMSREIVT